MPTAVQSSAFQATKTGFALVNEHEHGEWHDRDVQGIRLETCRESDDLGNLLLVKTLQLRVQDSQGERCLALNAEVGPWEPDQLQALAERILDDLFDRSWQELVHGGDVESADWSLSLIQFTDRTTGRTCPLQEISSVRWIGDQLSLFHEDQTQPIAFFDRDAENTLLLYRLLNELVEDVSAPDPTSGMHGLGKLLEEVVEENDHWLTPRRTAVIVSVPVAALVCSLSGPLAAMGIMLLMMMFLVAMPLLRPVPATLRLYERAVVRSRGSEESVLMLDQLCALTVLWASKLQIDGDVVPKAYLQFETEGQGNTSFEFHTAITPEQRDDLARIITESGAAVAAEMRSELNQSGRVPWTEQFSIHADGLGWQPPSGGEERLIVRTEIREWSLSEAALEFVLNDGQLVTQPTSARNFYPGLILLQTADWFRSDG